MRFEQQAVGPLAAAVEGVGAQREDLQVGPALVQFAGQGFGEYFVHRTGHSIGQEVHGNGANMDNLETHDERRVAAWTGFSVEPGIYLPEFGVRSEVNVFVGDRDARVTGEMQRSLVIL